MEWTTKPDEVVVRTERGTGLQWNRYVHSSRVLALGRGLYLNVVHDPRRNRAILDVLRDDCTLLKRHALDIPIVVMDRLDDLVLAVRTIDYPEVVVYGYRLHLREP